jgi:hypothetical protein
MIYLMLVPTMIGLLWMIRVLRKMEKHDRVLFPICQDRRDLMSFIRQSYDADTLTREDYLYARWMLDALNNTVALYNDHKARLFNFRAYLRFLKKYLESSQELKSMPRTENHQLREIEKKISADLSRGFISYTPFLRSEVLVRVLIFLLSALAHLGLKKLATQIEETKQMAALAREQAAALNRGRQLRTA